MLPGTFVVFNANVQTSISLIADLVNNDDVVIDTSSKEMSNDGFSASSLLLV